MSKVKVRVDRLIAHRTGESRSQIKRLIRRGEVRLDGEVVANAAVRCFPDQQITLFGEEVSPLESVLVYHKPEGVLTTTNDQWGRPCVGDILPHGYHIVGRLDADTRGLLLFSSNGSLTQHLLHPKHAVEREYIAAVAGAPDDALVSAVTNGVATSLGLASGTIVERGDDWVRLVMTEGKNRIVRRMLYNAGFPVLDLFRIRYGACRLGDLDEGAIRPLTTEERVGMIGFPGFE